MPESRLCLWHWPRHDNRLGGYGRCEGRFAPFLPFFWGIWNFSKNKSAAKSLLLHLSQPSAIEKLVAASSGYDLPSFANLTTLKTWAEEGPPKGALYHYPNPHNHQILSIAAAPSPPKIARQIYTQGIMTQMTVRYLQGEAMEKTLAWAESEVEGFMRSWPVHCVLPLGLGSTISAWRNSRRPTRMLEPSHRWAIPASGTECGPSHDPTVERATPVA